MFRVIGFYWEQNAKEQNYQHDVELVIYPTESKEVNFKPAKLMHGFHFMHFHSMNTLR
jgi:hypothetical protein